MSYPYFQERAPSPSEVAWEWGRAFAEAYGIKVAIELYKADGGYEYQEFDKRPASGGGERG